MTTYLEGVYWDLDGTIANTELEAHLPAFNFAFNDFNLNWNWDRSTYLDLLKINGGKNNLMLAIQTLLQKNQKAFLRSWNYNQ